MSLIAIIYIITKLRIKLYQLVAKPNKLMQQIHLPQIYTALEKRNFNTIFLHFNFEEVFSTFAVHHEIDEIDTRSQVENS